MQDESATSPARSALEEIETVRATLRATLAAYEARLGADLDAVRDRIAAGSGDLSPAKVHDLRDILTLLRNLDIKPEKGRRKDLKKIDSAVSDLALLVETW